MTRLAVLAFLAAACATTRPELPRDPAFAAPVDRPGLPNLHRVDEGVWRGAQPTEEGMRELAALGVRTVLNLRSDHSDRALVAGTGLVLEEIPMEAFDSEEEEVRAALLVLSNPARRPVFVHCRHGADRTGVVVALYRVTAGGWSKEDAVREMTRGGFGFHALWRNLVRFVERYPTEATSAR